MIIAMIYWLVFLLCCSSSGVLASTEADTPSLELESSGPSQHDLDRSLDTAQIPILSVLLDEEKKNSMDKRFEGYLAKEETKRDAEWSAALFALEDLQPSSKWRKSPLTRIWNKIFGSNTQPKTLEGQNYQIEVVEEGKIVHLPKGWLMMMTAVQLQLNQENPLRVNTFLSCDPYQNICKDLLLKLQPSNRWMIDNIIRFLVAPMAAQHSDITSYPSVLEIDIRLQIPHDHHGRIDSWSSQLVSSSSATHEHRVITIHLPYLNKLLLDHPQETIWREVMATITHEATHLFQWYGQKMESGKPQKKFIPFGSALALWPFSKSNSLSENGFQVADSVPRELLEGIANYVVIRSGLTKMQWRRPTSSRDLSRKWYNSPNYIAFFLEWLEMRVGEGTVASLMGSALEFGYFGSHPTLKFPCGHEHGTWETATGLSADELWNEYRQFVDIGLPTKAGWTWAQLYFMLFLISVFYLVFRDTWRNVWNQWVSPWVN